MASAGDPAAAAAGDARHGTDALGPRLRLLQQQLQPVWSAVRAKRWAEAAAGLQQAHEALVAEGEWNWPLRYYVLPHRGWCLLQDGRPAAAIPVLREAVALQDRLRANSDERLRRLASTLDHGEASNIARTELNRRLLAALTVRQDSAPLPLHTLPFSDLLGAKDPRLSLGRALFRSGHAAGLAELGAAELARAPQPAACPGDGDCAPPLADEYRLFALAELLARLGADQDARPLLDRALALNWQRLQGTALHIPSIEAQLAVFGVRRVQVGLAVELALRRPGDEPLARRAIELVAQGQGLGLRHAERMRQLMAGLPAAAAQVARWQALDEAPLSGQGAGLLPAYLQLALQRSVLLRDLLPPLASAGLGDVFIDDAQVLARLRAALPAAGAAIGFLAWTPGRGFDDRPPAEQFIRYAVGSSTLQIRRIGDRRDTEQQVARWRHEMLSGRGEGPSARGAALRDRLLSDLPAEVEAADTWVFVPDGALHGLPLEALPSTTPGRRLLHERTLHCATSLLAWVDAPPATAAGPARVLADPAYPVQPAAASMAERNAAQPAVEVPRLPDTRREARAVSEALEGMGVPTQLFLGAQASADALRWTEAPRYLHVAAHGLLFRAAEETEADGTLEILRPGRDAALLLADGEQVQTVRALDLQRLRLHGTELVVLSACSSGQGRVEAGEGVAGLRRAIEAAGARASVTALWPVSSPRTADLMQHLYRHLAQGLGPASALRQAKLDAAADGMPAATWAAFVLAGRG